MTHVGSRSKEVELADTLSAGNKTLMARHLDQFLLSLLLNVTHSISARCPYESSYVGDVRLSQFSPFFQSLT